MNFHLLTTCRSEGIQARKLRGFTGISLQCVPGFVAVRIQGHSVDQECHKSPWLLQCVGILELTFMCNLCVLMSSDSMTQKPSGHLELRDAVKN